MPSSWATCWVIWEIKAGPLSDWRERGRPKWGMISCMRNCVSSEAVSDIIGKASIHPEKVTMSFISYVRGMFSSVQFSCSVMSDSLRPHESQHARPPCPSPTPGVHSDSHPSGQWCHPAISCSVVPFSSCPQSLPASESFPMSQLFAWGGKRTGVSALASFLPKKSQGWSPGGM